MVPSEALTTFASFINVSISSLVDNPRSVSALEFIASATSVSFTFNSEIESYLALSSALLF